MILVGLAVSTLLSAEEPKRVANDTRVLNCYVRDGGEVDHEKPSVLASKFDKKLDPTDPKDTINEAVILNENVFNSPNKADKLKIYVHSTSFPGNQENIDYATLEISQPQNNSSALTTRRLAGMKGEENMVTLSYLSGALNIQIDCWISE